MRGLVSWQPAQAQWVWKSEVLLHWRAGRSQGGTGARPATDLSHRRCNCVIPYAQTMMGQSKRACAAETGDAAVGESEGQINNRRQQLPSEHTRVK